MDSHMDTMNHPAGWTADRRPTTENTTNACRMVAEDLHAGIPVAPAHVVSALCEAADQLQRTQENPMTMAQIDRDEFLTTKEVAALLGCSLRAVQLYCDQERLPHQLTLGGHRRIRRSAVEQIVAELTRAGRSPTKSKAEPEPSPQRGVLVNAMVTKLELMKTINHWREQNNLPPLQHDAVGNPRFASDASIVQNFHDGLRCALGLLIEFEQ